MKKLLIASAALLVLAFLLTGCTKEVEVPGETVVVEKEVVREVEVPGETVVVEKEVLREVEVEVPGETVVVEKEVLREVEVPGETVVVEREVVREVEVPGETVVVEKVVVREVEVPGETVVVEKEVVRIVEVEVEKVPEEEVAGPEVRAAQQTLIIGQESDISSTDLMRSISDRSHAILNHILEPLIYRTSQGGMEPLLLESWEVSENNTVYILHIREGIQFSDGEALNAEAVKVNLERMMDPETGIAQPLLVEPIKELTVQDEYTLRLETKSPSGVILSNFTNPVTGMQSPAMLKAHWAEHVPEPVGTGPFLFKERVPGERVVLVRNPDYWGGLFGPPQLDELIYRVIPDDATRMAALETEEIHIALGVHPTDAARLDALPHIRVDSSPGARAVSGGFNMDKPPFDDKRVRQAVNYAVNKAAIVEFILRGHGRVSDNPVAAPIFGYAPTFTYKYNPEKAKSLLEDAGHGDGLEIEFVPNPGSSLDLQVASAIASDLLAVGINTRMRVMDSSGWINYLLQQERGSTTHELYTIGFGSGNMDAAYETKLLQHGDYSLPKGLNIMFYSNPEGEALMDAAEASADPDERLLIYTQLWPIIMEDAPWLYLYDLNNINGVNVRVKDFWVHPKNFARAMTAYMVE